MQLGFEKAQEMVKTLLSLGASTAQADVDRKTVLQYCVSDTPDMLETLCESDETGIKRAINHIAVTGSLYSPILESPLITAIKAHDTDTAVRLLMTGAKPEIDFTAFVKAMQSKHKISDTDSDRNKEEFRQEVTQPVFGAIEAELPQLAQTLVLDHNVDVNSLSQDGWQVVNNKYIREYTAGSTVLDAVRNKIADLKAWKFKYQKPKAPKALKDDASYIDEYKPGTYARWVADRQLEAAKSSYEAELKSYHDSLEKIEEDKKGVPEKQVAIDDLVTKYEKLEQALLENKAKTFQQLYPKIKKPKKSRDRSRSRRFSHMDIEFVVTHSFNAGDLTDEAHSRYMKLFEAAWIGDIDVVKDLCLNPWKDESDEDMPPLKIAIKDDEDLSPFHIAVLQGHNELAAAILDIAKAQHYVPDPEKQRRYGIEGDVNSDAEDDSDAEVELYSEIVDDQFTAVSRTDEQRREDCIWETSTIACLCGIHPPCPSLDMP